MARGDDGKRIGLFGPWRGLNENPGECSAEQLEDAWNVDCRANLIETRGGRKKLFGDNPNVYPIYSIRVGEEGGAGTRTDYRREVSDGDDLTIAILSKLGLNATDAFYLGWGSPVDFIFFKLRDPNVNAATITVEYWSQASGWIPATIRSDGTSLAGKTLGQSGYILIEMPSDWTPNAMSNVAGVIGPPMGINDLGAAYWLRFRTSAALSTPVNLSEVYATLTADATGERRTLWPVNGIYQWRRNNGDRLLYVGMDDRQRNIARLFVLDRFQGRLRGVFIPAEYARSGPAARWSFEPCLDSIVCSNGYAFLHSHPQDPLSMREVTSRILTASSNRTSQPPSNVTHMAQYRGSLYAVSSAEPNTVRQSDPMGLDRDIASGEKPIGGWHTWERRADTEADYRDATGGPITGLAVVQNLLVVFTARSTHAWDGFALQTLDSDVGCIAPRSIAVAEGAVYFLGLGGVYRNRGGRNELLTRTLEPTMARIGTIGLREAQAVVYLRKKQYRLWVPSSGSSRNNLGLVFDYEREHWTKYGTPPYVRRQTGGAWLPYEIGIMASIRDDEWAEELLAADYDGNIIIEDYGTSDMGSTILSIAVSHRLKFGETTAPVGLRECFLTFETRGGGAQIHIGALEDGASWQRSPKQATSDNNGFTPNVVARAVSQLDPATATVQDAQTGADYLSDKQVYNYGVGTTGVFFAIESGPGVSRDDQWRSKRFVTRRVDFGSVKRDFQLVFYSGLAGQITGPQTIDTAEPNQVMRIRGLELDLRPREENR